VLTDGGFEPAIAASSEGAVTLLMETHYSALVVDIRLRGRMDGWEVAKYARQIDPAFPVIYITSSTSLLRVRVLMRYSIYRSP
jgi:CheY-like chemotaxis protein